MVKKHASPRILFPRTIAEALDMGENENEAVFWAGGTRLAEVCGHEGTHISLPRTVIALGLVEEMARASRSEHGLEIGAMMTLDRLAAVGRTALPQGLPETLSLIGTRPLRCRATIGGHIAARNSIGDLVPLLQLLEARVEIRFLRERRGRRKPTASQKRIPLAQLGGGEGLLRGELITRVSIPTENWNFAVVEKIPPSRQRPDPLLFQAIARVEKSVLVEWRMALSDGRGIILRSRDMEADIAGRPLPLGSREIESLTAAVDQLTAPWSEREADREAAVGMVRGFMRQAAG